MMTSHKLPACQFGTSLALHFPCVTALLLRHAHPALSRPLVPLGLLVPLGARSNRTPPRVEAGVVAAVAVREALVRGVVRGPARGAGVTPQRGEAVGIENRGAKVGAVHVRLATKGEGQLAAAALCGADLIWK